MNILKLKSSLFCLMAIAMLTVFLTSCEKDEIIPLDEPISEITSQDETSYEKVNLFFNDDEFTNKSEAEIIEYVENLNSEEIMNSKNDYLVAELLTSIDLFDTVISEANTDNLSKMDLSNYVNEQEMNEVYTKFYKEVELSSRGDCEVQWISVDFPCPGVCWKKVTVNTPAGSVSSDVPYPCKKTCSVNVKVCR